MLFRAPRGPQEACKPDQQWTGKHIENHMSKNNVWKINAMHAKRKVRPTSQFEAPKRCFERVWQVVREQPPKLENLRSMGTVGREQPPKVENLGSVGTAGQDPPNFTRKCPWSCQASLKLQNYVLREFGR